MKPVFVTGLRTVTTLDQLMSKLHELNGERYRRLPDPDFRASGKWAPQWRQLGNVRYYTDPRSSRVVAVLYGAGPYDTFGACHFAANGIERVAPASEHP